MSEILSRNQEYAEVMRETLKLRGEPVAIRLVREGEEYPAGYDEPDFQVSHCQAIFMARDGNSFKLPLDAQGCLVGASALNMSPTADKVASGEFHAGIGMHDTTEAAGKMISDRMIPEFRSQGEIVCPLKDADFEP
ncbi:MAG: DUF169 domain-containing protein, partial [Candidatus Methanomethylophilaceae archaeon]